MQKITAAITAVGGYVPEYRLTNKELETMVDTNDEWIKSRTGIEERRILKGEGLGSSDMGVPAVLELCKKRGIDPAEIDCFADAGIPFLISNLKQYPTLNAPALSAYKRVSQAHYLIPRIMN